MGLVFFILFTLKDVILIFIGLLKDHLYDIAHASLLTKRLEQRGRSIWSSLWLLRPFLWEDDLWPQSSNPTHELPHDLVFWFLALHCGTENLTRLVKHLISDSKVFVDLRHRSTNVELLTVHLPSEELEELLLEELHLVWLEELCVIAGELSVAHDTLHEVLYE